MSIKHRSPQDMIQEYKARDLMERMEPKRVFTVETAILRNLFKILVVADTPASQTKLMYVLKTSLEFPNVIVVESPAAAIEEIKRGGVALVLCAYRMSTGDGTSVYTHINTMPEEHRPSFVMATDYQEYEAGNLKKIGIATLPIPFHGSALELVVQASYVKYIETILRLTEENKCGFKL
jgi:CheY-like chemotaxis protein